MFIRIALLLALVPVLFAQENEKVWIHLEVRSIDPFGDWELDDNREFVLRSGIAETGDIKAYEFPRENDGYFETSVNTYDAAYEGNTFHILSEWWEDDCDPTDVYSYLPCASGVDDGHSLHAFPVNIRDYESGHTHQIIEDLGTVRLQYFFTWYPKLPVYYNKYVRGIPVGGFGCNFSTVTTDDFADVPKQPAFPILPDTNKRLCSNTPAYIKTLGGSIDKNYMVYVEYANSKDGPWTAIPGTPTFKDSIPLPLDLLRDGEVQKTVYIRTYRKSPGGLMPSNTLVPSNGVGWEENDIFCRAHKLVATHILMKDFDLIARPPLVSLTGIEITAPECNGGNNGTLNIQFGDITSFLTQPKYQASIRGCSDTAKCLDDLAIWEGNYGTKKFDTNSTITPFSILDEGYKVVQVVNINDLLDENASYGCPANYLINVPEKPALEFTYSKKRYTNTEISCAGVWDGEVTLDIDGGTKPYRVTHDSSRIQQPWITLPVSDSIHVFTGLRADSTYYLAVTDFYNCPLYGSRYAYDSVRLISPDTLRFFELFADTFRTDRFNPGFRHVSCKDANDGEVHVLLGSGRSDTLVNFPVNYWITGTTNGGAAITTAEIESSVSNRSGSYTDFPDLYAGKFQMHVRDRNGCLHSDSIKLSEPPKLLIHVIDSTDNLCFGQQKGNFSVFANGGTRPYWFNKTEPFNPVLVYRMCTDANFTGGKCTNTHSQFISDTEDSTIHLSELLNGDHTIRVRDQNNCIADVVTTLTSPPQIRVELENGRVTCHDGTDGSLSPDVSGGIAPYSYQWKKSEINFSTEATLSNLGPGNYTLDIRDANDCPSPLPKSAEVRNPSPLTARVSVQRIPSCADKKDAQIKVQPEGGWLEGSGIYQVSIDGIEWISEGLLIDNLGAGNYTVYVKDGAGCQIEIPNVVIEAPNALTLDITAASDVTCYGGNNGSRSFALSGGTAPYKVTWNAVTENLTANSYSIGGLIADNHSITFEDNRGCVLTQSVLVNQPDSLVLIVNSVIDASPFEDDGSAEIIAEGGTAPYSYSYNGGSGSTSPFVMTGLDADLHTVTIIDANFCTLHTEVPVSNVGGPRISTVTYTNPTCSNSADGKIELSVTGNAPFSFDWTNGATDSIVDHLSAGEYFVRIEDAGGLITAQKITLLAPTPLQLAMTGIPSLCHNECKGQINTFVSGGNGGYSLQWNTGATASSISDLCANVYSAILTDIKGCSTTTSVELQNPSALSINVGEDLTLCDGQQYLIRATSGWKSYLWTSSNGMEYTTQNLLVSQSGTYYLKVENVNNCIAFDTIQVAVSNTALQANFLLSTRAYEGETSVLIDDTWPRPSAISWYAENPDSAIVQRVDEYRLWVKFPYAGTFWFRMVAELGDCKDTVRSYVKVYERDDEEAYKKFLRSGSIFQLVNVYPNPASTSTTLEVELSEDASTTITLFDSWGKVLRFIETESNYLHKTVLDLSTLGQGMYMIQLNAGEESKSVVITIQ